MGRSIDSSASPVPLAPMLLTMSISAHRDVVEGIAELKDGIGRVPRRKLLMSLCLKAAAEQLLRTYVTLVWEAQRVVGLSVAKVGPAIEALQRRNVVTRVHKTRGDFQRVERACDLAFTQGVQNHQLARVAEVPRHRWTNREVHLFALLVPLAAYMEELGRELQGLTADPTRVEARLAHARREMEPVLQRFADTTQALQQFMDDLTQPRR